MRSGKSLAVGLGFAMLTLFGSLSAAHAQYQAPAPYYPPPPPRGMYRDGLVFGFGLGGGRISADGCGIVCGGAFMLDLRIGGMINPRMAILGDYWGAFRSFSDEFGDGSTVHSLLTVTQYWTATAADVCSSWTRAPDVWWEKRPGSRSRAAPASSWCNRTASPSISSCGWGAAFTARAGT